MSTHEIVEPTKLSDPPAPIAEDPPVRRRTLGAGVIEPEFAPKTGEALAEIDPENEPRTPLPHAPEVPAVEAPSAVVTSLEDDAPDGPLNPPREEPKRCAFRETFDAYMAEVDSCRDLASQIVQLDEVLRVAFARYFGKAWHTARAAVQGPAPVADVLTAVLAPVQEHIEKALGSFGASHGIDVRHVQLVLEPSGRFFLEANAYVHGLSDRDSFSVRIPAGSVDGPRGQVCLLEDAAALAARQLERDIRAKLFEGYT